MSKITNRVLTAKNQGLPEEKQKNARENIGVSVKGVSVDGNTVSFDTDSGEKTYTGGQVSDVTISDREEYKSVSVVHKDGDSVTVDIYDKAQVDELLANFGGFEKVDGTGEDCHPDVNDPNPRVIYLVEVPGTPEPDHCKEWIWDESKEAWECIGDTSITVEQEYVYIDPVNGDDTNSGWTKDRPVYRLSKAAEIYTSRYPGTKVVANLLTSPGPDSYMKTRAGVTPNPGNCDNLLTTEIEGITDVYLFGDGAVCISAYDYQESTTSGVYYPRPNYDLHLEMGGSVGCYLSASGSNWNTGLDIKSSHGDIYTTNSYDKTMPFMRLRADEGMVYSSIGPAFNVCSGITTEFVLDGQIVDVSSPLCGKSLHIISRTLEHQGGPGSNPFGNFVGYVWIKGDVLIESNSSIYLNNSCFCSGKFTIRSLPDAELQNDYNDYQIQPTLQLMSPIYGRGNNDTDYTPGNPSVCTFPDVNIDWNGTVLLSEMHCNNLRVKARMVAMYNSSQILSQNDIYVEADQIKMDTYSTGNYLYCLGKMTFKSPNAIKILQSLYTDNLDIDAGGVPKPFDGAGYYPNSDDDGTTVTALIACKINNLFECICGFIDPVLSTAEGNYSITSTGDFCDYWSSFMLGNGVVRINCEGNVTLSNNGYPFFKKLIVNSGAFFSNSSIYSSSFDIHSGKIYNRATLYHYYGTGNSWSIASGRTWGISWMNVFADRSIIDCESLEFISDSSAGFIRPCFVNGYDHDWDINIGVLIPYRGKIAYYGGGTNYSNVLGTPNQYQDAPIHGTIAGEISDVLIDGQFVSEYLHDWMFCTYNSYGVYENYSWDGFKVSLHFAERKWHKLYIDFDQGCDAYDGLSVNTPVRSMYGLDRACRQMVTDPRSSYLSVHVLSGSSGNNRGSTSYNSGPYSSFDCKTALYEFNFGYQYNWPAVQEIIAKQGTDDIPEGWHVPSIAELTTLYNNSNRGNESNGAALRHTRWTGTNRLNFNAMPMTIIQSDEHVDYITSGSAYYWTSDDEYSSAFGRYWYLPRSGSSWPSFTNKYHYMALRLVKDGATDAEGTMGTVVIGGKTYETVVIGEGSSAQTWMTTNLEYAPASVAVRTGARTMSQLAITSTGEFYYRQKRSIQYQETYQTYFDEWTQIAETTVSGVDWNTLTSEGLYNVTSSSGNGPVAEGKCYVHVEGSTISQIGIASNGYMYYRTKNCYNTSSNTRWTDWSGESARGTSATSFDSLVTDFNQYGYDWYDLSAEKVSNMGNRPTTGSMKCYVFATSDTTNTYSMMQPQAAYFRYSSSTPITFGQCNYIEIIADDPSISLTVRGLRINSLCKISGFWNLYLDDLSTGCIEASCQNDLSYTCGMDGKYGHAQPEERCANILNLSAQNIYGAGFRSGNRTYIHAKNQFRSASTGYNGGGSGARPYFSGLTYIKASYVYFTDNNSELTGNITFDVDDYFEFSTPIILTSCVLAINCNGSSSSSNNFRFSSWNYGCNVRIHAPAQYVNIHPHGFDSESNGHGSLYVDCLQLDMTAYAKVTNMNVDIHTKGDCTIPSITYNNGVGYATIDCGRNLNWSDTNGIQGGRYKIKTKYMPQPINIAPSSAATTEIHVEADVCTANNIWVFNNTSSWGSGGPSYYLNAHIKEYSSNYNVWDGGNQYTWYNQGSRVALFKNLIEFYTGHGDISSWTDFKVAHPNADYELIILNQAKQIAAGSGISITESGNQLIITSTGGGGGGSADIPVVDAEILVEDTTGVFEINPGEYSRLVGLTNDIDTVEIVMADGDDDELLQEASFEFVTPAEIELASLTMIKDGRILPSIQPSEYHELKQYQGTIVNGIGVIAEFEPVIISITSIKRGTDTGESIDLNVIGDNITDMLEYELALDFDGTITVIDITGKSVTLTGNLYTAYIAAEVATASAVLDGHTIGPFNIKGTPPVVIDGRSYDTVQIGSRIWMAENLASDTAGGTWYNNDSSYDSLGYGKLYTLNEVMAIDVPGWHLPSGYEMMEMASQVDLNPGDFETYNQAAATKLMSEDGWTGCSGTNDIGFNAIGAGILYEGNYVGAGSAAWWLCYDNMYETYGALMMGGAGQMSPTGNPYAVIQPGAPTTDTYKYSVRLVKDFTYQDGIPDTPVTINGITYNTVRIGDDVWLAENIADDTFGGRWYDNSQHEYGKLYSAAEVLNISVPGWHVATFGEMYRLHGYSNFNPIALKDANTWTDGYPGDGAFGFNAMAGGYILQYPNEGGTYSEGLGTEATFYATYSGTGKIASFMLNNSGMGAQIVDVSNEFVTYCSVRLVKDR